MKLRSPALTAAAAAVLGCAALAPAAAQEAAQEIDAAFRFPPLPSSAGCSAGGRSSRPFVLPGGFRQVVIASEPEFPDLPDMHAVNETGPQAGRFLYRTHETTTASTVTVTDLQTRDTFTLAQRPHWERFDGIVWTPWGTILAAEEVVTAALPDPRVPQAKAGLVYEIDPSTGRAAPRPAIGSRSHEGLRFDRRGNLYGISESSPPTGGYIYRFTPDAPGDLTSGELYALQITHPSGDRIGRARWIPLDRGAVQIDSDAAATAAGATGYGRPEDVETVTSTGRTESGIDILYVAITSEARILAIDLRGVFDPRTSSPASQADRLRAFVSDYVKAGVNAPLDFEAPDNLALDSEGNLYITEDPGGSAAEGKTKGDDIWVAKPSPDNFGLAEETVRFASLTDCDAEPTGVYFGRGGGSLFVNVQHRGADGPDLAIEIVRSDP